MKDNNLKELVDFNGDVIDIPYILSRWDFVKYSENIESFTLDFKYKAILPVLNYEALPNHYGNMPEERAIVMIRYFEQGILTKGCYEIISMSYWNRFKLFIFHNLLQLQNLIITL